MLDSNDHTKAIVMMSVTKGLSLNKKTVPKPIDINIKSASWRLIYSIVDNINEMIDLNQLQFAVVQSSGKVIYKFY